MMVIVIVDVPPTGTTLGAKALVITGGPMTVNVFDAPSPGPLSMELIGPVILG